MRTTHIQPTAMRHAFNNIKVARPKNKAHAAAMSVSAAIIGDKLATKAGNNVQLDWNAKLSFETAKQLDAPNYNPERNAKDKEGRDIRVSVFRERALHTGTYNRMVN